MDVPKDDRRVHNKPIPRFGGIAIFAGMMVALATFAAEDKGVPAAMAAFCGFDLIQLGRFDRSDITERSFQSNGFIRRFFSYDSAGEFPPEGFPVFISHFYDDAIPCREFCSKKIVDLFCLPMACQSLEHVRIVVKR